ncbi:MAG: DUF72 domain-containing protein [Anaerolineales bacterium]
MNLWVGTSGYSYKEWKGKFYPAGIPDGDMLRSYAEQLPSVEINNTFYRLPKAEVLEAWAGQVPANFRFVLKASRRISHNKRLREVGDETEYLYRTAGVLGRRLGVILFQMPPNFAKDLPRLQAFLELIPTGQGAALEFRHASWFDDEVFDSLRARGCALCYSDTDEDPVGRLVSTANWGYLRLRKSAYSKKALTDWVKQVHSQGWEGAYVYFKEEEEALGPKLAMRFLEIAGAEKM